MRDSGERGHVRHYGRATAGLSVHSANNTGRGNGFLAPDENVHGLVDASVNVRVRVYVPVRSASVAPMC